MERTVLEVTDIAGEAEAVLITVPLGMTAALMVVMVVVREVRALERTSATTPSPTGPSRRGREDTIAWTAVATTTTEAVVEESWWRGMGRGQMRTRARATEGALELSIIAATRESFSWRWSLGSQMFTFV